MRIMGRRIVVLLVLLTLLAVTGGGGPAAQPAGKVVIKFSHNQQTITPPHKAAGRSS
jgi:hypothetical protein